MKQGQMKVEGGKELAKLLRALPDKVADKLMANATSAGGRKLAKAIAQKTPVDTGRLRDSIKAKRDRKAKYTFTMKVGPVGKGRFYAHLVEFGSAPHVIKVSKKKRVLSNGRDVFGKIVQHPGISAKPFMRPALDESAEAVIKHVGKNLGRGTEREAKKLAGTYKTNKR